MAESKQDCSAITAFHHHMAADAAIFAIGLTKPHITSEMA